MIHKNVTVRKVDGRYEIEWTEGKPMAGDQVLMSAELFEDSVEALNLGLTTRVLGPGDRLVLTSEHLLSGVEIERISDQLRARGLEGRVMLVDGMDAEIRSSPAPGHDATGATRGACRASAPCPACAHAMHGKPPTSESGVSKSKDGSR